MKQSKQKFVAYSNRTGKNEVENSKRKEKDGEKKKRIKEKNGEREELSKNNRIHHNSVAELAGLAGHMWLGPTSGYRQTTQTTSQQTEKKPLFFRATSRNGSAKICSLLWKIGLGQAAFLENVTLVRRPCRDFKTTSSWHRSFFATSASLREDEALFLSMFVDAWAIGEHSFALGQQKNK